MKVGISALSQIQCHTARKVIHAQSNVKQCGYCYVF